MLQPCVTIFKRMIQLLLSLVTFINLLFVFERVSGRISCLAGSILGGVLVVSEAKLVLVTTL